MRQFWLAFLPTLVLLVIVMIVAVAAVQPGMPERDEQAYTYTPSAQDTLTVVISGAQGDKSDFALLRYNPQHGQIPLIVFPGETLVQTENGASTLQGVLDTYGYTAVKRALENELEVNVDRYIGISEAALREFMSRITSVPYTLPRTFSYSRDGAPVLLEAGERRLDAQDIFDLLKSPELRDNPRERAYITGELIARGINENLLSFGEPSGERLFKLIVNAAKTDLNAADFELRRESANFLSQVKATVCANLTPEFDELANGALAANSESVAQLRKYYEIIG